MMQQRSQKSQAAVPQWGCSPDVWVMLNPAAAYRLLVRESPGGGIWLVLKRPLLLAFVLGCTMSLITTASLTLRLVGPATIYWSFVPLVETGALAAVCWSERRIVSFPRAIDLFFTGHGPWTLWLIGLSAIWSFFPPVKAFSLTGAVWLYGASAIVILWSAYIDFCFFRFVVGRNRTRAGRDLLLHRSISWSLIIAIFGEPVIWPDMVGRFGR
jgi:hypothetical protein